MQGLSANIKLSTASNSDKKNIQSNGHLGNTPAVPNTHNGTQPASSNRAKSVGKGSSETTLPNKIMLNKLQHKQREEQKKNSQKQQCEAENLNDDDDDDDYYYTDVLSRNDRQAGEVVGRLRSACAGSSPTTTDTVSDCNDGGNLGYRSLDPEGMDLVHTYHTATGMQSNATRDGPQPEYSEPDINKRIPAQGHRPRPTPPTKVPPRLRGGHRNAALPTSSRSSVDCEYVDPNSNDLNSHMYQGLTPKKQEYLALYMTPESSPH